MIKTFLRQSFDHIGTSHLIYEANELTGFYMMAILEFNELDISIVFQSNFNAVCKSMIKATFSFLILMKNCSVSVSLFLNDSGLDVMSSQA